MRRSASLQAWFFLLGQGFRLETSGFIYFPLDTRFMQNTELSDDEEGCPADLLKDVEHFKNGPIDDVNQ